MVDWKTVETLAYSYYVAKGYRIFVPLVTSQGYDFLAVSEEDFINNNKNIEYIRVNAKLAYRKDPKQPDSWAISTTDRGLNNPDAVDIFLTWLPEHGRFIELPGTHFVGSASTSRRIPVRYYKDIIADIKHTY